MKKCDTSFNSSLGTAILKEAAVWLRNPKYVLCHIVKVEVLENNVGLAALDVTRS